MTDTFLIIYPKLLEQNRSNSIRQLNGLWLAHGDEPLLQQWLTDALRQQWRVQHYAIKRLELVSTKTWQDVMAELNSLSLFDEATAVIVTGNHKPDKVIQAQLSAFSQEANNSQHQNCLLWLSPKQDKRSQGSKWFAPFAANGHVIDCNLYNEQQRQQLLQLHANRFGLQLSNEAWQLLMLQTEHHLLSAYQALWRLSYLFITERQTNEQPSEYTQPTSIDADALHSALVSNAQYSVFDLSDAMLAGNTTQAINIIEQLKSADEPTPLVLWTISKDMRLIMQLMDGQDPQSIGIWRNKQSLYQSACRRQTKDSISDWADLLYDCDKAIKGVIMQPAWELLLQAVLRVTGHRLFG